MVGGLTYIGYESLARPGYTYRGARRNTSKGRPWVSDRKLSHAEREAANHARKLTLTPAGVSLHDRHARLENEQNIQAIKRSGNMPPPHTKEGAYVRALVASVAPKIGPGKPSIHTLHRKIAISEQRDYFNRKPAFEAALVRK
jgi:hypothetical protein